MSSRHGHGHDYPLLQSRQPYAHFSVGQDTKFIATVFSRSGFGSNLLDEERMGCTTSSPRCLPSDHLSTGDDSPLLSPKSSADRVPVPGNIRRTVIEDIVIAVVFRWTIIIFTDIA